MTQEKAGLCRGKWKDCIKIQPKQQKEPCLKVISENTKDISQVPSSRNSGGKRIREASSAWICKTPKANVLYRRI